MKTYHATVKVTTEYMIDAERVLCERLDYDEQYDKFEYTLEWEGPYDLDEEDLT